MSRSMLALLLALGVTSASPVVLSNVVNSVECLAVNDIVTVLKASSATPFCSAFLSIGTSTVSTTQTVTPSSLTATSTSLTTAPAVTATTTLPTSTLLTVTDTATTTPTVFTTVTTTSYSTYGCISGATTLPSTLISGATSTANAQAVKRATTGKSSKSSSVSATVTVAATVTCPAYLSSWPTSQISTACECLGLTSATVTSTIKTTLAPGTVTTITTSTISPTATATVYSTSTQYTTTTVTTTLDAVTSTITNTLILPTPSGLSTGLNYYAYQNTYDYTKANPGFDATTWNSASYQVSGFTPDVNLMSTFDYPAQYTICKLPGQTSYSSCGQVTVVMQGYFYAAYGAGTYTLSTPSTIDNGLYFWDYETAFNDYNNNNVAYQAVRAGSSGYYGGSVTLDLAYGEVVPVTIMWVNGGNIGAAFMSITDPSGNEYSSTEGFWIPADDSTNCPNLANPFSP